MGQVAEGLHRLLRRREVGHLVLLEDAPPLGDPGLAEPAGEHRLARALLRRGDHRLGHRGGLGHRLGGQQYQDAVDAAVLQRGADRGGVAVGGGVAEYVDRVGAGPELGEGGVHRLQGGRRELRQGEPQLRGPVGGQHAGPAAVGDDCQAVAAGAGAAGEYLGRREEIVDGVDADGAGAAQGRVEDVVGTDQGAGVGGRGLGSGGVAARLEDDHGFHSRRRPQAAHEGAAVSNPLDVEQYGIGLGVHREVVEYVAEVDVGGVAQRHHGGEADPVGVGPVQYAGADGARLGDQRQPPGPAVGVQEGGVEPDLRSHEAEAVGPEQPQVVVGRRLPQLLLQPDPGRSGLAETGGEHQGDVHLAVAALTYHFEHCFGRGGDDRQVDRLIEGRQVRVAGHPLDTFVPGVDREQPALEFLLEQVVKDTGADGVFPLTGAKDGDAAGPKEAVQVVGSHFPRLVRRSWSTMGRSFPGRYCAVHQ